MKVYFHIIEDSLMAYIAAYNLKKVRCAIVFHKTIFLWGITKQDFLKDEKYVNHELQHILQYKQAGTLPFLISYLWESIRKGYYNNKFEVEARAAETLKRKAEFELK